VPKYRNFFLLTPRSLLRGDSLDGDEIKKAEEIICKYKMTVSCISTTLFLMTPLYTNINVKKI